MSADNWTTCPRCSVRADEALARAVRAVTEAYGKLEVEDFLRLSERAKLDKWKLLGSGDNTLREDYEVGINEDGEFFLYYTASCKATDCTFKYEKRIEEKVKVEGE